MFEKSKQNINPNRNCFHRAYIYASGVTRYIEFTQNESINPLSIKTLPSYTHEIVNSPKMAFFLL